MGIGGFVYGFEGEAELQKGNWGRMTFRRRVQTYIFREKCANKGSTRGDGLKYITNVRPPAGCLCKGFLSA